MNKGDLFMPKKTVNIFIIVLAFYILISFMTLSVFPFVHSDETWLSSLSEAMLENNTIQITEPSFDLYPRHPHAIKLIFNFIQMIFIQVFGHTLMSIRMISLLFSLLSALFFYKIVSNLTESKLLPKILLIFFLTNIQFFYMSHFARQEAVLMFLMLLNIYYLTRPKDPAPIISGLISAIAIGIHPNSFIIFLPILSLWLMRGKWMPLLKYVGVVSLGGGIAIAFSYLLDPHFISNYLGYGAELGVKASIFDKIFQMKDFYLKLYYGVSGTYYTPDIKIFFYLFGLTLVVFILFAILGKVRWRFLIPLLAVHVGYILVGRYNQTSIVFILPLLLLILVTLLDTLHFKVSHAILGLFMVLTLFNTYQNITSHPQDEHYDDYLTNIQTYVPDGSIVLGNLNTLLAFDDAQVYDYRNLGYLDGTISDYIKNRNISYIIYPEEMDFIYEHRPLWNDLYGNVYPYYDDLQSLLETEFDLIGTFESPIYAMRIVRYIGEHPYSISIYKIK
jgi:4-amino-4-deoxy-L-arabinose transferase-like glycosyltransferase